VRAGAADAQPLGVMVTVSRPGWRPPRRFLVPFVVVHSLVSIWLVVVAFGQGMTRFETGAEPTFVERTVDFLSGLLPSPLFTLVVKSKVLGAAFPGLLGWAPLLANSVLWAFLAWWLIAIGRRLTSRDSPLQGRHPSDPEDPSHHFRHDA
jgi:hypothetical protein